MTMGLRFLAAGTGRQACGDAAPAAIATGSLSTGLAPISVAAPREVSREGGGPPLFYWFGHLDAQEVESPCRRVALPLVGWPSARRTGSSAPTRSSRSSARYSARRCPLWCSDGLLIRPGSSDLNRTLLPVSGSNSAAQDRLLPFQRPRVGLDRPKKVELHLPMTMSTLAATPKRGILDRRLPKRAARPTGRRRRDNLPADRHPADAVVQPVAVPGPAGQTSRTTLRHMRRRSGLFRKQRHGQPVISPCQSAKLSGQSISD